MSGNKVSGIAEIYRLNLIRLRKKAGLSRKEAAARYGCEPNFISQVECGHIKAGGKVLEKFSQVYGFAMQEVVRVPPEIGDEELDKWWMRFYNLPEDHLSMVENIIELIAKHEAGKLDDDVLAHLNGQIKLLLKLSS